MSSPAVAAGAIAFVGPAHVPSLEGFTYVLIVKVQGTSATVRQTGPDCSDESPEFDINDFICVHLTPRLISSETFISSQYYRLSTGDLLPLVPVIWRCAPPQTEPVAKGGGRPSQRERS
jgi:hypothetical protein